MLDTSLTVVTQIIPEKFIATELSKHQLLVELLQVRVRDVICVTSQSIQFFKMLHSYTYNDNNTIYLSILN